MAWVVDTCVLLDIHTGTLLSANCLQRASPATSAMD